jgi:diadenylate cyclase
MLIQPLGHSLISFFWLVQLANILLIAMVVRVILKYLWRTPAMPVVLMFIILLLLADLLGNLGFYTLSYLLQNLTPLLFIAIVVIFHDEIRDILATMGRYLRHHIYFNRSETLKPDTIQSIVDTCRFLKKKRLGGLLVIEQQESLESVYKVRPVEMDRLRIRPNLVAALLQPPGVLHDGAIIIRNGEIVGARAILPLSRGSYIPRIRRDGLSAALGTRHRAAIGITEVSDAIAVVVSEESGDFGLAYGGILEEAIPGERLAERLAELTSPSPTA